MKKIILFFSLLFTQITISQTFDWETAADNGTNVTQTVSGITATVSAVRQGGGENVDAVNGGGFEGTSGVVVFVNGGSNISMTVSFSSPVNILRMRVFEAGTSTGTQNWTFTPSGGGNSPITHPINLSASAEYTFNWTNVDSFTITVTSGGIEDFGLDDIVLGVANSAPTDISLTATSINQSNTGTNATVGTLSTTDADGGDSHTYSLVSGTGSTNNGSFNINGTTLRTNNALTPGTYAIRINTNDGTDDFAKQFTITVVDNVAPSAPSTPDLSTASDSGNEGFTAGATSDNLTNNSNPNFTGTAEANTTVRLISSIHGQIGSATADGSGNWSITSTTNLSEGVHTITATATDANNNTSGSSSGLSITTDYTQPTVTVATSESDPTNGDANGKIPVTITFSHEAENVKLSDFTASNGTLGDFQTTDSTSFTLRITPSLDGNVQLNIGAGRAFDRAGNANTASNILSLTFDGTGPTVSSVSVPANATYPYNENLNFTVNFNENVTVTTTGGTPQLALTVGTTTRQASYISGSGTPNLVFRYTTQSGDNDSDGIVIGALSANGGTLQDAVGNNATLTLNSVGDTSGVLISTPTNNALNFDGTNDLVDLTNNLNTTIDGLNTFTVEAMVRPETNTGFGVIVGNYHNGVGNMQFLLRRDGSNYTFWVDDGTGFDDVVATGAVSVDTWTHIAGVWDGSQTRIYINGVLSNTKTGVTGASFASNTNPIRIGYNNLNENFNGDIDEVRIWSDVRTQPEIDAMKATELNGAEANLLGYYNFNLGTPNGSNSGVTTLVDVSSNDNNGTLSNFDLSGTSSNWVVGAPLQTVSSSTSVAIPSSGGYVSGQNLDFTVNYSDDITVNTSGGTPQIALTIGTNTRQATYVSGSGTSSLLFRYTVQTDDVDTDGITVGTLSTNGGTLRNSNNTDVNLNLNSVGDTGGILIGKQWSGATSTDWATASNWSPSGVPSGSDNIVIPNVTNKPIIGSGTNALTNNMTIDSGSSLTVNAGASLSINGNLTQNGTFTVLSDATSNGSLIVNGMATGNVTYSRYVSTNWHLIGAPVTGQSLNSLVGQVNTSGNKYALAPYLNTTTSLLRWNYYTNNMGTNDIDAAGNFLTAKGYTVQKSTAGTISFTGTLHTNNAGESIAITDGGDDPAGNRWNVIANPYTAAINASNAADATNNFLKVNIDAGNLDPTKAGLYLWNGTLPYQVKSVDDAAFYIAPGQAFFVHAPDGGGTSASFTEAMQSHQTGNIFLRSSTSYPEVILNLTNGTSNSLTKIRYIQNKTTGLDVGSDVGTFTGTPSNFSVFTHLVSDSKGDDFAIQALPNTNYENMIVPIGVYANANQEITFSTTLANIPSGLHIYLEDRQNNTFTQLNEENSNYKLTLKTALNGIGRFYLHTTTSALSIDDSLNSQNVSIYKINSSTLRITGLTQERTEVSLYNVLGKQVFSSSFTPNGIKDINLPNLSDGVYLVQLKSNSGKINKKIILE